MAGLPHAGLAIIDRSKITEYLLADSHPAGRPKAVFFRSCGFRLSQWQELRDALLAHSRTAVVIAVRDTEFGRKYILQGPLRTADGRLPGVRAIWFVAVGERVPRLVTVYPMDRAGR